MSIFNENDDLVIPSITLSKSNVLSIIGATIAIIFVSSYFFIGSDEEEIVDIESIQYIDEEKIDHYLESILLASKNNKIDSGFEGIVDSINLKIINEYSEKLNLTEEEKAKTIEAYYSSRSKVIDDIHKTMLSNNHYTNKKDISYKYLNSVNGFSESIAGFACGVASFSYLSSLSRVTKSGLTKYIGIKPSCKFVLTKVVNPATDYLRDKAIVKDVNIVTFNLEERVRSSILKLATAKDTYSFSINDKQKRTIDPFGDIKLWGLGDLTTDQESELRAYVEADVTAGFNLKNFSMNVEHQTRTLTIHLSSPIIMSNEVDINFRNEERDFFSPEIDSQTYNSISYKAKMKARYYAEDSDLYDKAKESANLSIMNIFQPLMDLPQFKYKVKLFFDNQAFHSKEILE